MPTITQFKDYSGKVCYCLAVSVFQIMALTNIDDINRELADMHWLELAGMPQHVRALDDRDNIVSFACNWLYLGRNRPAMERYYTCLTYHKTCNRSPRLLLEQCHHHIKVSFLITGCAVAQHCCKGDQPFQWEAAKFAPPYISNPLIFQHQIWHR